MDSKTAAMQRFPPNTLGYIVRESTSAYRFGTYKIFLNYVKKIERSGFFKLSYTVAFGSPTIIRKDGKKTEYQDNLVYVHIKRGERIVDMVTFCTVHKYFDWKTTIVKPNSKNSRFYREMKKSYRLCRKM